MKFILGLKLPMSQFFDEKGNIVPITLIEAGPCFVTQLKTTDLRTIALQKDSVPKLGKGLTRQADELRGKKDGYDAIQVGFKKLKAKKVKKSQKEKPFKYLREFRGDVSKYKIGDKIDVSVFQKGDIIKVSAISKGKGFAGAVKRWGFSGLGASHGAKHRTRTLGSVGSGFPQRVLKGKKMPGRMGNKRITVKNLEIVKIDKENNLIAVKGAVPGRKGTLLEIRG